MEVVEYGTTSPWQTYGSQHKEVSTGVVHTGIETVLDLSIASGHGGFSVETMQYTAAELLSVVVYVFELLPTADPFTYQR